MAFVIKEKEGTYYQKMTGIGPMFGGAKKEAMRFDHRTEAAIEMGKHSYGFTLAEIEEIHETPELLDNPTKNMTDKTNEEKTWPLKKACCIETAVIVHHAKDKEHEQQIKDIISSVPVEKMHGGGNWRRILIQWQEEIKKKYNIT